MNTAFVTTPCTGVGYPVVYNVAKLDVRLNWEIDTHRAC